MEQSKSMTPSPPGAHAATAPATTGSVGTSVFFGASAEHRERVILRQVIYLAVAASHSHSAATQA